MTAQVQPIHTLYGGADRFAANSREKLCRLAHASFREYAPDPNTLMQRLGITDAALADTLYQRVDAILPFDAVQDLRVDFEDGFGLRSDDEEDREVKRAAIEMATAFEENRLPPFTGIRIKSPTGASRQRALRTLEYFLLNLLEKSGGDLPANFVITLPKIRHPEQVEGFCASLSLLEQQWAIGKPIAIEVIAETPQLYLDEKGRSALPRLVHAAHGRLRGVHFGTYDFLAENQISSIDAGHRHPLCDWARMQLRLAFPDNTVWISDSITNVMPVAPHRGKTESLNDTQRADNAAAVWQAWRTHYDNVRHSLFMGLYQGWDLHPAQIPMRYLANMAFFLSGLHDAQRRMKQFVHVQTHASLQGNTFDDLASARTLLNFLRRGRACGAFTEADINDSGLTVAQLADRHLFNPSSD